ncbi:MAG: NMT1-like family, partial [Pseudomonadota bacterium]
MYKKSLLSLAIAASFTLSPIAHAAATKVELATGDEKLSYHNVHGKALQEKLKKYNLNVTLLPTKGSTDNILKIENGIVDMALAQEDVYAMASVKDPE